jgi:hypothetical protein
MPLTSSFSKSDASRIESLTLGMHKLTIMFLSFFFGALLLYAVYAGLSPTSLSSMLFS